jgi:hypothetical protein
MIFSKVHEAAGCVKVKRKNLSTQKKIDHIEYKTFLSKAYAVLRQFVPAHKCMVHQTKCQQIRLIISGKLHCTGKLFYTVGVKL